MSEWRISNHCPSLRSFSLHSPPSRQQVSQSVTVRPAISPARRASSRRISAMQTRVAGLAALVSQFVYEESFPPLSLSFLPSLTPPAAAGPLHCGDGLSVCLPAGMTRQPSQFCCQEHLRDRGSERGAPQLPSLCLVWRAKSAETGGAVCIKIPSPDTHVFLA